MSGATGFPSLYSRSTRDGIFRLPVCSSNGRDASGWASSGVSQSPQLSQAIPDREPQSRDGSRYVNSQDSQRKYRHPRITVFSMPAIVPSAPNESTPVSLIFY